MTKDTKELLPTLKPCPFCGGEAHYELTIVNNCVRCGDCSARVTGINGGDSKPILEDWSVTFWNTRTPPAPNAEVMDFGELEAAIKVLYIQCPEGIVDYILSILYKFKSEVMGDVAQSRAEVNQDVNVRVQSECLPSPTQQPTAPDDSGDYIDAGLRLCRMLKENGYKIIKESDNAKR